MSQVKSGPSDRSFGVHVAKVAQFPDEVVQDARQKAIELERFSGGIESILENATDVAISKESEEKMGEPTPSPIASSQGGVFPAGGSGKRVQSDPHDVDEVRPVPDYIREFYERPLSDFQNAIGEIDMAKFKAFVKEIKAKKAAATAMGAAPMDI